MRLLLCKNKIILFRIFKRVGLFVFGKICLLGLSFFVALLLVIFVEVIFLDLYILF